MEAAAMLEFFRAKSNVTRIATPRGTVVRSSSPLMQQRGWQQTRTGAEGPFATRYGTWPGRIENAGDTLRVSMRDPPPSLRNHPKWPCFHKHGNAGWYRIHLATNPVDGDPNAVIRYVEQIITESFKL
jgi:hypothetical protein